MRPFKFLTIFFILFFLSTSAFSAQSVVDTGRTPYAYEKLSVTTGAVVRPSLPYRTEAGAMFITVESNSIRYRIDGGDPDSDDGHLVVAAAYQNVFFYDKHSIRQLRMIGIVGTATVIITYYRELNQ